jgi:hypothetical protein
MPSNIKTHQGCDVIGAELLRLAIKDLARPKELADFRPGVSILSDTKHLTRARLKLDLGI